MSRKKPSDAPQQGTNAPSDRKPPVHEVRIGRIRACVWANSSEEHGTWHSVTISRTYREGKDGPYRSANSYGRDDCLVVAEVMRLCWLWIASHTGSNLGDVTVPGGSPTTGEDEPLPI